VVASPEAGGVMVTPAWAQRATATVRASMRRGLAIVLLRTIAGWWERTLVAGCVASGLDDWCQTGQEGAVVADTLDVSAASGGTDGSNGWGNLSRRKSVKLFQRERLWIL
jgi:hypothetical protein